ncbi:MAG: diguanylate cyclase domain-containing protein [Steroidobacteraceae bacterium]
MSWPLLRMPLTGASVRSRLLYINILLLIAQATVGAIAWHAIDVQNRAMSELSLISKAARYHQDADTLAADVRADVYAATANAAQHSGGTDLDEDQLAEHVSDLRRDLRTLAKIELPADLSESLGKVESVADDFVARSGDAVRAVGAPSAAGAVEAFSKASDALAQAMDRQTQVLASRIIAANELADSSARTAKNWLVAASLSTTILLASLVGVVGASIRRSLRRVRDVASQIASGNLAVRNDQIGRDEVGQLATSINQMADSLNDVIGKLRADAERDAFNNQLGDALEAADTETAAYGIVARAMHDISPSLPAELLVSDSSRSHLERAAVHPGVEAPGCTVESPFECLAVRRGTTQTFEDSDALNACTHVQGRSCGRVSAVCVPLSFMGRAIGVLHAAAPFGQAPTPRQVEHLAALGSLAGSRLGTVRAFARTQTQASTDALTGLMNRRAAAEAIRTLTIARKPYAFVLCDLDHFKQLNDRYGHESGDMALRAFADVLRRVLREGDVAARWGGEEFAVILPNISAQTATDVVARIQTALRAAVAGGSVPAFTSSFGIADSSMSTKFRDIARLADTALYAAKDAGRDRGTIAQPESWAEDRGRHTAEHPASIDLGMLDTGSHESVETWPGRPALIRDALHEEARKEPATAAGTDLPLTKSGIKR